jgi:hypothetical protein
MFDNYSGGGGRKAEASKKAEILTSSYIEGFEDTFITFNIIVYFVYVAIIFRLLISVDKWKNYLRNLRAWLRCPPTVVVIS